MYTGLCHSGTWGALGTFGGWVGLIVNLVFWIGLIAGLALLVLWAFRRARVPATNGPAGAGRQQTTREILQAQYARGEITREQYELQKQALG